MVWFSEVERWNPGSFKGSSWAWPPELVRPLGAALVPRVVACDAAAFPERPPLVTIRFDGSVERRDTDPRDVKGRLFVARAGDLVYSKIDVRNGAIGIVPPHLDTVTVTAEFPVHHVRPDVADTAYLQLLVRSSGMRREIQTRISGASGRKRVKPADLLDIHAPFPELAVQRAIVGFAGRADAELRAAETAATTRRSAAEAAFLVALGYAALEDRERPKVMTVRWSALERWGVLSNQLGDAGHDLASGRYPVAPLGSVVSQIQYGTSAKANVQGRGMVVVRICNVKDGTINFDEIKHVEMPEHAVESLRLAADDILIIRTSGSRGLVGTTAVVPEGCRPAVFASYLIRLRVDPTLTDPRYVSAFINGSLGRVQVEMAARQIMQNNINSEEIRGLRVPLPPLAVQRELVAALGQARAEVEALRNDARARHARALDELDRMILGALPVTVK